MSTELSLTPSYRTTCPLCGNSLFPVARHADSAPWLCVICWHGWWAAELSEEARAQFRRAYEDFGVGAPLAALQAKVEVEHEEAIARGTSARSDTIQLLPLSILQHLPQEGEFGVLVKMEITRKGG